MKRNMNLKAKRTVFRYAYDLRTGMTKAEALLWNELKGRKMLGIRFRRQHTIHRYILDFYAHEVKLGIELDGVHHKEPLNRFYDQDRTDILRSYGINIIRFTNNEVTSDLDNVKLRIEAWIQMLRGG